MLIKELILLTIFLYLTQNCYTISNCGKCQIINICTNCDNNYYIIESGSSYIC